MGVSSDSSPNLEPSLRDLSEVMLLLLAAAAIFGMAGEGMMEILSGARQGIATCSSCSETICSIRSSPLELPGLTSHTLYSLSTRYPHTHATPSDLVGEPFVSKSILPTAGLWS